MPIDIKVKGLDYTKVGDNTDRTLEGLRSQIEDIRKKNQSILDNMNEIGASGINPNANFTKEEFEASSAELKKITDNMFELTSIQNSIFESYGDYLNDSMKQVEEYSGEMSEAMQIMRQNQQKFDDIKSQIIARTEQNDLEVDDWLTGLESAFVGEIQSRLAIQEETFVGQTNQWISTLWAVKDKELAGLARFQVQALLKTMIVNLSTQILIENLAVMIKRKLETIDDIRVLLTQELTFLKNSLTLFNGLFYSYRYGNI